MNKTIIWRRAAVGVGVNLGNRETNITAAGHALAALPHCRNFHFSPIFETAAVDCAEPLPFLNAVVAFDTALEPEHLLALLQDLEQQSGRERPYPNAPRVLDLDLLLHGREVRANAALTLPHPRMKDRLFVLTPLTRVWSSETLPVFGRSATDLEQDRRQQNHPDDVISMSRFQWPAELITRQSQAPTA